MSPETAIGLLLASTLALMFLAFILAASGRESPAARTEDPWTWRTTETHWFPTDAKGGDPCCCGKSRCRNAAAATPALSTEETLLSPRKAYPRRRPR